MKRRSHALALLGLVTLAVTDAATKPAGAVLLPDPALKLDVTYTNGSIVSGPLSFGLGALPASVDAAFVLGAGVEGSEPAIREFFIGDVVSADIAFGDGTWSVNELNSFSMETLNGAVTDLVYVFNPITTGAVADGGILNFPLTITGTVIPSGPDFEYVYASSTQTLTAIPEPASLALFLVGLGVLGRRRRRAA